MITLVIYGIIAIALASAAGYAFLVFSNTARQTTQLQENQVRMETAAASLRASLLALNNNGTLFAPMGNTPAGSYTQLPTSLGAVGATPWGAPYEYCPVSQTGTSNPLTGTASSVTYPSGATYAVTTYSSTATQNLPYVITSPTQVIANGSSQSGYVAFIVSSLGPSSAPPDCSKIQITGSAPTVPGGSVRGITSGFSFMQRVVASSDRTEIYVNPSATGNGTGVDAADAMTSLDAALGLWQALQPRLTDIYLEAGVTYTSANDLNAQDVRPAAMGEDSSLVIETNPSEIVNNNISSHKALVNFSNPLTIRSRTTFQNLYVNSGSSPTITAYAPVTFKYGYLGIQSPSSPTKELINVYNTNITFTDSYQVNVDLNVANSTVEFYDEGAPTMYIDSIMASSSVINFEDLIANEGTINVGLVGAAPGYDYAILLSNSTMTIGNFQQNSLVASYFYPMYLSNSRLTINTNGSTINGVYGSELSMQSTYEGNQYWENPITAYDGSSIVVQGTLVNRRTANGYGMTLVGSSLAINGVYQYQDTGISQGAIAATESTITGKGTIEVPNRGTYPSPYCVAIVQNNENTIYPIVIAGNVNGSGYPDFNDVKAGGVPLLFSYTSTKNHAVSATDTATAAQLVQSQTAQTYPNIIDPYVSIPQITALPQAAANYSLDPTTFEAAVRTIVNKEYVKGLNINFDGTCQSY